MRTKSLPLSVRSIDPRNVRPPTSKLGPDGPARNHRWRNVIATLIMAALVPALVTPNSNANAALNAPTIVERSIAVNATGVSIFNAVAVRFDRQVTGVNRGTFVLRDWRGQIIPATVTYDTATRIATLVPAAVLRAQRIYRVALSGSIRDGSSDSLRRISWSFTTGAQPSAGVRFSPPRDVRFAPGRVTGIRVDGRGTVVGRKTASLVSDAWAAALGRATINGKSYFLIANGLWAGYYVPSPAIVESRAQPPAVSKPSASTSTPQPAATPTPPQGGVSGTASSTPRPTVAATPKPIATPTPTQSGASSPVPSTSPATSAPTPKPPVIAPSTSGNGILILTAEIQSLPMSGAAWDALKRAADGSAGSPNLADMNQDNNVNVLAKALVYARTGTASYRSDVIAALRGVMGTDSGGETLAVGRELAAYVIAADLIGLHGADPALDATFRGWLSGLLDRTLLDGNSITSTHEQRPNNWGTHAGASRAAVAAYLGDGAELGRVAAVFRGWVGERDSYAGFKYGDLWWQSNPSLPVGINPPGATLSGHNVDGVLPDDQRRTGEFAWPPPCGNYPHGAMDGALLTAEILRRAGYPAYQWGSNAIFRAEQWLQSTGCPPSGDNVWQLPLLDARYGTGYWNGAVVRPGKNFGWTDWLYGR